MKYIISRAALIVTMILLIACSNTTLLPEGKDTYTIISPCADEGKAYKAAMKQANEVCSKEGKVVRVLCQNSNYQGIDKNTKAALGFASIVASCISKSE